MFGFGGKGALTDSNVTKGNRTREVRLVFSIPSLWGVGIISCGIVHCLDLKE